MLIFDHFNGASDKVRGEFVAHLKEGRYLQGLLQVICHLVGHGRGKPIDPSRFNIESYTPNSEDTPLREAQSQAVLLYFLCLKLLPSLTRAWWIDTPRRPVAVAIESWTEKFMSPLVTSHELDRISQWVESGAWQADDDEGQQMQVTVSKRAKEIRAGYEVDDQNMQMVIRLPGAYPLQQATVEGVNRVAVDEKKWRSWLLSTQGVITFSNGSIIDGLTAWRRNVSGALKGQTECAICYSIISADKQLPSKKCGTCKNLFHSSCLYRWFKSSNSSSCPLCRNPFNYA
ncbi:MAG: hypothetical protein M1826_007579 [Phylliscum demangeonii]|nr:MAG: hypothetical protein M1826_007579 [Phylliscum demangeonii]